MTVGLSVQQINEHMKIIRDECKNIVMHQKTDQQKLNTSLNILTNILKHTGNLYSLTNTPDLTGVVNLPSMDGLSGIQLLRRANSIIEKRNEFFDLYKKLPEGEKKQFDTFMKAHKFAMNRFPSVDDSDLKKLPKPMRSLAENLLEKSLRTE